MDFEDQLGSAMRASVATAQPPVHALVAGGLARGKAVRRRRRLTLVAAAVVVLLVGGVGAVATYDRSSRATTTTAAGSCDSVVRTGVLPRWAWGGFSGPKPRVPHVMSADGRIVAILFGETLHSPPAKTVSNKILWVSRTDDSDALTPLRIDAVRAGTSRHVHREVSGGPGPSNVDLPAAGCWRVRLRWGPAADQRDTMDLVYVKN